MTQRKEGQWLEVYEDWGWNWWTNPSLETSKGTWRKTEDFISAASILCYIPSARTVNYAVIRSHEARQSNHK